MRGRKKPDDAEPTLGAEYGPLRDIEVELARKQARELRAYHNEGDWYGCYECVALDSQYIGERMVLPFAAGERGKTKLGDRAPDTKTFGPGWKFTLQAQLDNPDEAVAWLHRLGDYR